jgi:L-ascorbate metabolism protein UlaG (beta-lactamase superfamily)
MHLQLLRNATLRVDYAGRKILIDPCLGSSGSLPSFAGVSANPTVELPTTPDDVLQGVELAVISHLHPDHFDAAGEIALPKHLPVFCQPADLEKIMAKGFIGATALRDEAVWNGLSFRRTDGQHGTGEILEQMGSVMGFVLRAQGEPTVYWVGDTVLTDEVLNVISNEKPDVIVVHSGGAMLGGTLLIMDDAQTIEVARKSETATILAVHMEALDHCTVTRSQLRSAANEAGIPGTQLLIPADGERIEL